MKRLTHAVRRSFWALVFLLSLSFATTSGAAVEPPVMWEPFGYVAFFDAYDVDLGAYPQLYTFSKVASAVCGLSRLSGPRYCPRRPSSPVHDPYCTKERECIDALGDFDEPIGPVCRNFPRTATPPPDAISLIGTVYMPETSALPFMCTCPAGSFPDLAAGVCVSRRLIYMSASRDRYVRKEANVPVSIDVLVRRDKRGNIALPDEPVTLSVRSSSGQSGTVTPASGRTYANGSFRAEYRFPAFTKSQIDTITATCDTCGEPAILDIKMAPVVLGFFNGVWNTEEQAKDGLTALKELAEPLKGDVPIRYENFYNQNGAGNGSTRMQDVAETFIQRGNELDGVLSNRGEHYWDLLSGRHSSANSLTGSLLSGLGAGSLALAQLIDATFNATLGQIIGGWARLLSDPPTTADAGSQLAKLRALADEGSDFVLVAHSQGNLFVNLAFDGLRNSHPETIAKVVHVAPASPTTRGEHGLSDNDLVINGLRVQGYTSVQPANWNIPFSSVDASGHTLVATYLDATREGRGKTSAMIANALDGL